MTDSVTLVTITGTRITSTTSTTGTRSTTCTGIHVDLPIYRSSLYSCGSKKGPFYLLLVVYKGVKRGPLKSHLLVGVGDSARPQLAAATMNIEHGLIERRTNGQP